LYGRIAQEFSRTRESNIIARVAVLSTKKF